MIRLRIGKEFQTYSKEGLLWYKGGRTYRVLIEKQSVIKKDAHIEDITEGSKIEYEWVPVEVIDEV